VGMLWESRRGGMPGKRFLLIGRDRRNLDEFIVDLIACPVLEKLISLCQFPSGLVWHKTRWAVAL